jgi:hypothetical protein
MISSSYTNSTAEMNVDTRMLEEFDWDCHIAETTLNRDECLIAHTKTENAGDKK